MKTTDQKSEPPKSNTPKSESPKSEPPGRAFSNSPSHSQFLENEEKRFIKTANFRLGIDRLTVVGSLSDKNNVNTMINLVASDPSMEIIKTGYDRFSATIGDHGYVEYDKLKGKAFDRGDFRIEFNPNKVEVEAHQQLIHKLLKLISDKSISRIDLAFDTSTIDLSEYLMFMDRPTKETEIRGINGALETKYLGVRRSDRYVRLYDKKKELRDKQDIIINDEKLWRLEFELKHAKAKDYMTCLKGFNLKKPNWKTIESFNERAKVYMLLNEPNEWTKLNKNTKTKYKKMINEISSVELQTEMHEILKENENNINEYLDLFLKDETFKKWAVSTK